MDTKQLQKFFEENDFNVHLYKEEEVQVGEIETWTSGGVNMIIFLRPFTKEEFYSYVNDFNVDNEIELYRQAKDYCSAFTIRESLDDFEEFHCRIRDVMLKLEKK